MTIFVIAKDGTPLMPTFNIKKVRKQIKDGRVVIVNSDPFTVQQTYEGPKNVQPIEFTEDTGYQNIGVSICSEKHEYASEERILLTDEVEHHKTCHKMRRTRRNRKTRYRKKRFDNRTANKPKGWMAPSLENKKDQHLKIFGKYKKICPITSVVLEIGQFDTQVLRAVEEGKPVPEGLDYQHGEQYGYDTLREAVFARDKYKCIICEKSGIDDNAILRMHHLGYWRKDRTNRMGNLATICTKCHNSKNHKKGGKLYGLPSINKSFAHAAFMNTVKYQLVEDFRTAYPEIPVSITFGAITKHTRNDLNIEKSHANDAYCIGSFHPKHRAKSQYFKKRRRNNRVLEKFYDAQYIDIRDGSQKAGGQIGCNRTNRRGSRNSEKNERIYHGEKLSKGRRNIRRQRYEFQQGDIVLYEGKKYMCGGVQNYGNYVVLYGLDKAPSKKKVNLVKHAGGWLDTAKLPKKKNKTERK